MGRDISLKTEDNNKAVTMYLAISNIHFANSIFMMQIYKLCFNPPNKTIKTYFYNIPRLFHKKGGATPLPVWGSEWLRLAIFM